MYFVSILLNLIISGFRNSYVPIELTLLWTEEANIQENDSMNYDYLKEFSNMKEGSLLDIRNTADVAILLVSYHKNLCGASYSGKLKFS